MQITLDGWDKYFISYEKYSGEVKACLAAISFQLYVSSISNSLELNDMTIWQNQVSGLESIPVFFFFPSFNTALHQLCHEQFPLLFLFAHISFIPCQAFDDIQQVQLCLLFLPEHGPGLLIEFNRNFQGNQALSSINLIFKLHHPVMKLLFLAWSYSSSSSLPRPWPNLLSLLTPLIL